MPLTATAFYFEDSNHVGAALVSVDLFAVPSVFHQEVARVFAARGPQSTLALERIVIAATHTHQGTSNFFSVAAHNRKASNVDGFDSRLRAFLIARLVAALDAAIADAARHPMFDLEIVTGLLPKTLLRNRSPKVFMENLNANDILDELGVTIPSGDDECGKERLRGEPRHDWKLSGCPRLRAVDRTVSLLRLRRDGRTAALAVFLAVHPTLLPSKTPLFSQDVFGVARDALEHSGDRIGYVTFFNGAEGDITLRRTTRDAADLIRLGQSLAAKLKAIHDTGTLRSIVADRIEGKLHFAKPGDAVGAPPVRLAAGALGGSEAIRGAEDDPGPLLGRVVAFVTRRTRRPRGEHGVKVPALLGVQKWTDSMFPPH